MDTATAPAPTTLAAFEVGATYDTGRGDYVWTFTVVKRTARFITIEDAHGKTSRVGVTTWTHGGAPVESAMPLGRYSQCPVIFADRKLAA